MSKGLCVLTAVRRGSRTIPGHWVGADNANLDGESDECHGGEMHVHVLVLPFLPSYGS
jgi:hypothetical protein